MATISWELQGTEYGNCNCDYGCPCQFNGRPTSPDGDCRYALFTLTLLTLLLGVWPQPVLWLLGG